LKKHERGGASPYVGNAASGIQTEGTCRMTSLRIILLFLLYLLGFWVASSDKSTLDVPWIKSSDL
jgi:hypothetical protein